MEDFTPTDAHAVETAMIDMREAARKYRERKPESGTGAIFERKAAELKTVRDKILDQLPERFHEHRAAYPDYHAVAPNE
jgi:hypothetical protein